MEYILLIHNTEGRWQNFTPELQTQMLAEFGAFTKGIIDSGHYRASNRLVDSAGARTVRYANGKPKTTDGPFAETKEALGGYYIIEAKDLDEATAIAAGIPSIKTGDGGVEVRPMYPSRVG